MNYFSPAIVQLWDSFSPASYCSYGIHSGHLIIAVIEFIQPMQVIIQFLTRFISR